MKDSELSTVQYLTIGLVIVLAKRQSLAERSAFAQDITLEISTQLGTRNQLLRQSETVYRLNNLLPVGNNGAEFSF